MDHVAVAVSGGGDSMALLHLMHQLTAEGAITMQAVTVDHGLRPEAADEARQVSQWAAALGVQHSTLTWDGWRSAGNLQAEARRARYALMVNWAKAKGVQALLLAHTVDDQAETVLMGLARASGVDGLAAMPERRDMDGVALLRPLLKHSREDLRRYLQGQGRSWIEDPSNHNDKFERIRMRQAGEFLADLGLTAATLSRVAQNMAQSQTALDHHAQEAARKVCLIEGGDVVLDPARFAELPQETARRILLTAASWVNGGDDRPRRLPTLTALEAIASGTPAQLAGCLIVKQGNRMRVCREFNTVREVTCLPGQLWDNRWCLTGPDHTGVTVAVLGAEGLQHCPDWRETGRPHAAVCASPAAWSGDKLVAAPLAGWANGWQIAGRTGHEEFFDMFLSH